MIDFIVFAPVRHSNSFNYTNPLKFKEFRLAQPNGQRINVLEFKTEISPKASVLFLHGATKSIDYWSSHFASFFIERSCNFIIPDYRGYGKSDGSSSEFNWYEDAQLTYSWLKTQTSQDSIIIVGYGLGAVAAAYLGTLSPCRMVILINPVYGIRTWIREKLPALVLLPRDLKYDFNSYEYIPNIISPTAILLNKNLKDMPENARRHLQTFVSDQGTFYELDHTHNELPVSDSKFSDAIDNLFKSL
ncbi:MAG: alpha/beta fold hydrolase [Saprospiraceae bacterium]|nr:alpha/beta fold hydrolase [Saprospiraceae bacterium]